jgi:hypothetical protein
MAFKIQISNPEYQFDDTIYFKEYPSKTQILEGFEKRMRLAGEEWHSIYRICMNAVQVSKDFPSSMSSRLAMRGIPLQDGCSITIWQFHFED